MLFAKEMRHALRFFLGLLLGVGLLCVLPREARAFERQFHVGADGGFTLLNAADAPKANFSGGFGLHYAYGLSDAFNLLVEANASFYGWKGSIDTDPKHPTPHTLPGTIAGGGVGVAYVFDVLRWVPYAGVLVGASYFSGGNLDSASIQPDLQLAAGLDYQLTRSWAVGVAYRQHLFVTSASTYPSLSFFALRAEFVWGF